MVRPQCIMNNGRMELTIVNGQKNMTENIKYSFHTASSLEDV